MCLSRSIFLAAAVPMLVAGASGADDWPQFRGARSAGLGAEEVPVELGKDTLAWSVPLPGAGSGSPVVREGKVFILGGNPDKRSVTLVCLDAGDGSARWQKVFRAGNYHMHPFNNLASGTPCVGADTVVVPWYDGAAKTMKLSAVDFEGNERWEVELGDFNGEHGPSLNPVMEGDRVIVAYLHDKGGFTAAHALQDGKKIWQTPYPDGGKAAYGTPLVRSGRKGREVVITGTTIGMMALDFETGAECWSLPDILPDRAVCSPIELLPAGSGESLIQAGCKMGPYLAVRPPVDDGKPVVAWSMKKQTPYVPSPVAANGTVYVLAENGAITAMDARSGKVRWIERLAGNFYASPLVAGDRLYCLSRDAEMFVVKVGENPKQLGVWDLKPGPETQFTDATPAMVGGRILVRVGARLDCYGK